MVEGGTGGQPEAGDGGAVREGEEPNLAAEADLGASGLNAPASDSASQDYISRTVDGR
jgi:hypothetical protein